MTNEELTSMAQLLAVSPTMQHLAELAQTIPMNPLNDDDFQVILATCLVQMVQGLDANRITFGKDEDKAMFVGLLVTAMVRVLGQVPTPVTVSVH